MDSVRIHCACIGAIPKSDYFAGKKGIRFARQKDAYSAERGEISTGSIDSLELCAQRWRPHQRQGHARGACIENSDCRYRSSSARVFH